MIIRPIRTKGGPTPLRRSFLSLAVENPPRYFPAAFSLKFFPITTRSFKLFFAHKCKKARNNCSCSHPGPESAPESYRASRVSTRILYQDTHSIMGGCPLFCCFVSHVSTVFEHPSFYAIALIY